MDRQQLTDGLFGATVHRRAVDQLATLVEQRIEHRGQVFVARLRRLDIESAISAQPYDRQGLVTGRNGPGLHGLASCSRRRRGLRDRRTKREDRRSTGSQREYCSTGVTLRMAHKTLLTSRTGSAR